MLTFQRDGLAVTTRGAFHRKEPGAHGIHPCRHVFLAQVVVSVDSNSGEGLSHHLAGEFLVEEAPVQQHLYVRGAG